MVYKKTYQLLIIAVMIIIIQSCIEPYDDFKTETFESALVIEATITNELKQQEILLSRTFALEEDGPSPEINATVKIIDNTQQEQPFQEIDSGKYVSINPFRAEPNKVYKLSIQTNNGKFYASDVTKLTHGTETFNVSAIREFNKDSIEGVSILVNSYNSSGNSNYYRYEYQETYKIIAPKWSPWDLIDLVAEFGIPEEPYPERFVLVPRSVDEHVCYNTLNSNKIIIGTTVDLNEDRVSLFSTRFISRDNFIISHRYSILVRQYIQSREAYFYYKTLKNLSELENLFSQNQPGFFSGNIHSEESKGEKVIGFFEVVTVNSHRLFFNYEDLFPNEELPPFANSCNIVAPPDKPIGGNPIIALVGALESGIFKYFEPNGDPTFEEGPFDLVPRECGDCTVFGKTEIPDFWIE